MEYPAEAYRILVGRRFILLVYQALQEVVDESGLATGLGDIG